MDTAGWKDNDFFRYQLSRACGRVAANRLLASLCSSSDEVLEVYRDEKDFLGHDKVAIEVLREALKTRLSLVGMERLYSIIVAAEILSE